MLIFIINYAKKFLFANSRNTQTTTFVDVINKFVIYFERNIDVNLFEFVVENFDKLTENAFSFLKKATINFRLLTNDFRERRRRLIDNNFLELKKLFQL